MKSRLIYFAALKILILLFLLNSVTAYSQPDYNFQNSVLLTPPPTNLKVGALYSFPAVKPGIDARVSITAISPGVTLTELDGTSGYPEALQPTVDIAANTSGYVEFTINFVVAGTTNPSVQAQIPATCIDVDGAAGVHEYDQINMGGGLVDFDALGGELSIGQNGNWFTGTNIAGIDYPGRDTIAKQVMFTVVHVNISSIIIRVGIDNQTASSTSRLRSVYFKRFVYNNSILALPDTPNRLRRQRDEISKQNFRILPNSIQSTAKISLTADESGSAMFQLVDYSGRLMSQQQISLNKGANNIPIHNLSGICRGNYVAVLKIDGKTYNQKIIKK